MGMFSTNRTSLGSDIHVEANESYIGIAGAYRAMCESYQNSYTMFEQCIGLDFMEAAVVNEGASQSQFEVIQENFVTDLFDKCKEILVKLMEKIKGIVKSFIDRVVGTFIKDGKELVRKYKDQILKKDLSKMTYKYAKRRKGNDIDCAKVQDVYKKSVGTLMTDLDGIATKFKKSDLFSGDGTSGGIRASSLGKKSAYLYGDSVLDDIVEKINDSEYLEKALGASIGKTDTRIEMSEYAQEAKEYMFEDEEEDDEAGKLVSELMVILQSAKDEQKSIKDDEKKSLREIKEAIDNIDRVNKEVMRDIPDSDTAKNKKNVILNKYLNTASRLYNQMSAAVSKAFAVKLELYKFHFAQSKRVWVQMAAYRPKSVKEDAILLQAIGEAAEYDTYTSFTIAEME